MNSDIVFTHRTNSELGFTLKSNSELEFDPRTNSGSPTELNSVFTGTNSSAVFKLKVCKQNFVSFPVFIAGITTFF